MRCAFPPYVGCLFMYLRDNHERFAKIFEAWEVANRGDLFSIVGLKRFNDHYSVLRTMKKAANSKPRSHRWLGQLVLILAIFMVLHWWRSEPLASGDAPVLTGDLAGGGRFDLDGLQGKPVLVHFWATWCPVCRFGDDTIAAIAEDFNVITVAIQSGGAAEIMGHLSRASLSFPVIPDSDGVLATAWGVSGVPASFVLDGSGRIRFATVGYTTGIGLRGRLWAAGMLD